MKNYEIRRLIESEVQSRGRVDTRLLIARLANRLKIPKQKICGNLRCMIYDERSVSYIIHKPHTHSSIIIY